MLAVYGQQFLKEQNIFETPRLGTYKTTLFGNRTYEMSSHLGNVMAMVSDRVKKENGAFDAVVISAQDYYPYGLMMAGRTYSNGENSYRFGFQGQEEDSETSLVNYKYRMHNPRIGRFFSVDPLAFKFPYYSPYAFSGNRVLDAVELEGLEPERVIEKANDLVGTPYEWGGKNPHSKSVGMKQRVSSKIGEAFFNQLEKNVLKKRPLPSKSYKKYGYKDLIAKGCSI